MKIKINVVLQTQFENNAHVFKGQIHGMDRMGMFDIEFPDMTMASRFVQAHRIETRTTARQSATDGQGNLVWHRPVVLSIDLKLPATAG